ncbi:13721_t:CDS:2, partial [Acaulospora morrowiae]
SSNTTTVLPQKRVNKPTSIDTSNKKAKKPVNRDDSPIVRRLIKELATPTLSQNSSNATIALQTFPTMDINSVNFHELNEMIIKAEDNNQKSGSYYFFGKGYMLWFSFYNKTYSNSFYASYLIIVMGKKELSAWIRSGVVEKNLNETLDSTLDALYDACPLRRSRESICKSLHDLLYSDETFRQSSLAHIAIFGWFENRKLSPSSSSSQKQSKPFAEQGAIIEPFINLTERAVYDFLVNNEDIIPLEVVESFADKQRPPISKDFRNADLLCMLNFILKNIAIFSKKSVFHGQYKANPAELLTDFKKKVRNKLAHGIVVNGKDRWSDHALQHVSILACEVIICLGGNYEEVFANREDVDSEITKRWIDKASQKRKSEVMLDNEGNVDPSQKRKFDNVFDDKGNIGVSQKRRFDDSDLGKITEFVLDIFEDLEVGVGSASYSESDLFRSRDKSKSALAKDVNHSEKCIFIVGLHS